MRTPELGRTVIHLSGLGIQKYRKDTILILVCFVNPLVDIGFFFKISLSGTSGFASKEEVMLPSVRRVRTRK